MATAATAAPPEEARDARPQVAKRKEGSPDGVTGRAEESLFGVGPRGLAGLSQAAANAGLPCEPLDA